MEKIKKEGEEDMNNDIVAQLKRVMISSLSKKGKKRNQN